MKKLFLLLSLWVLTGCIPRYHYYQLDENYLYWRQVETRRYEAKDEETMLIFSTQVLQDLGFTLEETEMELGLITASKDRPIQSYTSRKSAKTSKDVYDTNQRIYVTLVTTKSHTNPGYNVRVKFARVIWDSENESRDQRILDPQVYQEFFARLSESVLLTGNDI